MNKEKFTQEVMSAESTMYHIAKSILIYDSDCEDAVQDAILKAFSKLNSLREECFFKTWLIRILIHECYRYKRAQKKTVPLNEDTEIKALPEYSDIYQAVLKLKEPIRIAVTLHYIEGYSVKEISEILRIPQGTVKSRLHTGRTLLRKELQNE